MFCQVFSDGKEGIREDFIDQRGILWRFLRDLRRVIEEFLLKIRGNWDIIEL